MAIFTGGAFGTLVRLTCPRCGEVQARAKNAENVDSYVYACRICHHRFTVAEGRAVEESARRRSSRPPPLR